MCALHMQCTCWICLTSTLMQTGRQHVPQLAASSNHPAPVPTQARPDPPGAGDSAGTVPTFPARMADPSMLAPTWSRAHSPRTIPPARNLFEGRSPSAAFHRFPEQVRVLPHMPLVILQHGGCNTSGATVKPDGTICNVSRPCPLGRRIVQSG